VKGATPPCQAALRDHRARLPEALTVYVPKLRRFCENRVTAAMANSFEIFGLADLLTTMRRINQPD
jgi:hypothetical protein